MTKVGILDDEILICETLFKYLNELGYEVPDYAITYEEGLELLNRDKPDIMLLDINISGPLSGIDFAHHIRAHHNIPLIFVSSYSDKTTIDSAKTAKPNGYLIKPFSKEDLYSSIETAISNFGVNSLGNTSSTKDSTLFIKQDSAYIKVQTDDILYVKSDSVYLYIHTSGKKYLFRETLKKMLDNLPHQHFLQVHRSYIINLSKITSVSAEYVTIGEEMIPVSKSYKEELMKKIHLL